MNKQAKHVKQMLERHQSLNHLDGISVTSHVQRQDGDWFLNTLMLQGYTVAFKYRRKKMYQSLKGQKVNITYYRATDMVAGLEFEYMKVTRLKRY
ncbi:hypothetical protein FE810_13025 [Thalassotalea litorea]|uniref:Uncharacterized protein n=1 Tax=Thalassotalea litorea TaxID=2020715 RepID=A0A5R9IIC5_9GAMM|nr:hypothetical protein [Thalassotalea litorea]TLU64213.1 hypothetical protein FE810_13025 [Thalassotalea litorea]